MLDLEEPNTVGKLLQLLQGKGEAWSGRIWLEEPENHEAVEFSSVKSAAIFQASLFGLSLFLVKKGDIRHHFCVLCSCISQCSDTWALSFERKQLGKDTAELQPLLGIFDFQWHLCCATALWWLQKTSYKVNTRGQFYKSSYKMGFLSVMQWVERAGQAVSRCVLVRFSILSKHSASVPLPTEEEDNSSFKERVSMLFILFSQFWAEGFLDLPRNWSHCLLPGKLSRWELKV